ncbi:MAG: FG-GAP-like repeat-containing protein [Planctomycetes bacterium]|nr:FG-GAP-like repeat-containing protein [Planctomycetota bacterium]
MNSYRVTGIAFAIACCAGVADARQSEPTGSRPVRDPDRGLDPALRAKLASVDERLDSSAVEHWATAIGVHLREVSVRWSEDRFDDEFARARWIDGELRVGPLFDPSTTPESERGAWRVHDGKVDETAAREPFARALAAWRGSFRGAARLDFEVIGFEGAPPRVEARVRVSASGANASAKLQHNATWSCAWRLDGDAAELVDVRVVDFEAVELPLDERGLCADVTEELFEDPTFFRERLAPGLDHWRARIAATLFPGALGHHGLALGDVDGDGLEDLYLCRPGGLPNQLLLHTPRHTLVDASAKAGVDLLDASSSALLADFDGDGDVDLVVSTGTGLVFFANDGAGHFERKGLLERSLATSLAAADFDRDGDLDLYACSYLSPYEQNGLPVPYHDANNGEANMLLRNDGAWRFVDVASAVGLEANNKRFSFAAAWEDFDDDGDQDLYVANDFGRNNLYRNDGGRFVDVAAALGVEDIAASMGVDWGDVDRDGRIDLYVTNMHSPAGGRLASRLDFRASSPAAIRNAYRHHAEGNSLFLNRGDRGFSDAASTSGTAFGRWGWGAIFVDFDDDGALDLFAPNGFVTGEREPDLDSFFWRQVVTQSPEVPGEPGDDYSLGWRAVNHLMRQGYSWNGHERNVALLNVGGARFADASSALGLDQPDDSRAAARIDWDGDGDEDLIVTNRSAPMLRVFENRRSNGNAWIAFDLRGSDAKHTAVGARVTVEDSDGRKHASTLRCGAGYLAQSTSRVHFGLGRAGVRGVTVRWPSGETEDFGAPKAGAAYRLVQGTHAVSAVPATAARARSRANTPPSSVADACVRTVLPTPLPLPRLVLETWDGKPAAVLGITLDGPQGTGRPLVLMLWSVDDAASRFELERIGAVAEGWRAAGIEQVLALSVDAEKPARERAVVAWKETAWPFARAFVGEEALSVLELVDGALHDDARGLTLPAAFLIDGRGRLVAEYRGPLDTERLREDLALFDLDPAARRDASVPFPGRWIGPLPQPLESDVASRLQAHGLERPASEYSLARVEVRESSAANVEFQIGVARERQGQLADAVQHYRRALALDPSHLLAAQSLAVALHRQGEQAAALAAYKEALKLDPADAQTRCNLGYLYLALKDVAGAEGEVRALRTLKSELAEVLEAKVREFESK